MALLPIAGAESSSAAVVVKAAESSGKAAADAEGYSYVCGNGSWTFYFNFTSGALYIQDKKTGFQWRSTPRNYDADKSLAGSVTMRYDSQLFIKYADQSGNIYELNSKNNCVRQKGFAAAGIKNGIRATYTFPKQNIVVPVTYTLTDHGLDVSVPVNEIRENDSRYMLTGFSVLPYFGAGGRQEEGYLVVPDGSGAVIKFNNGKSAYSDYKQYVYGRDNAIEAGSSTGYAENALLPVFGIANPSGAMLAVMTSGESRVLLNAHVTGSRNAFNTVYSEFIYRDSTMASFNDKSWNKKEVRVFEGKIPDPAAYSLSYYFLDAGSTYTDMALCYQQYLRDVRGVKPTVKTGDYPLYVNTYGSVKSTKHIFGFPVKTEIALTTYDDTKTILKAMQSAGVNDLVLKYNAWIKGGPEGAIPVDAGISGVLGGKAAFRDLAAYLSDNGIPGFFDINVTDMYKSRWGYIKSVDSSVMLNHSPAIEYQFELSTLQRKQDGSKWYLLNPLKVFSASTEIAKKLSAYPIAGASLDTLSHKLYSSYNEEGMDRASAQTLWTQSIAAIKQATGRLMGDKPNAYMLGYADYISSLPAQSSKYAITDYDIPFYQIALHGLTSYAMESNNRTGDHALSVLTALETGSSLQYTWIARNSDAINKTQYNTLYSAGYTRWIDDAAAAYQDIAPFMKKVADQPIVGHETLQNKVRKTTYKNGLSVIVNYSDEAVEAEGIHLAAKSYRTLGE